MDIHVISTLTLEDEACIAAAICTAAGQLLDQFSVMYTIRIETTGGQVFHRNSAPTPGAATASNLAAT